MVPNKAERVYHFHQNTVKALADMLAAAGVSRPEQLTSHHMLRRITPTEIKVYADIYYYRSRRAAAAGDQKRVLCPHVAYGDAHQFRSGDLAAGGMMG